MSRNPTDATGSEIYKNFVLALLNAFFDGWILMVFLGVAHAERHVIPTLGYWQSFFGAYVVCCLCGSSIFLLTERVKKLGTLVTPKNDFESVLSKLVNRPKV